MGRYWSQAPWAKRSWGCRGCPVARIRSGGSRKFHPEDSFVVTLHLANYEYHELWHCRERRFSVPFYPKDSISIVNLIDELSVNVGSPLGGAGTTNPPAFDDGDPFTGLAQMPGKPLSTLAAPEDDDIENFRLRHGCFLSVEFARASTLVQRRRRCLTTKGTRVTCLSAGRPGRAACIVRAGSVDQWVGLVRSTSPHRRPCEGSGRSSPGRTGRC